VTGKVFFKQRGWFRLDGRRQGFHSLTITLRWVLLFLIGEVERNDVEQEHVEADVCEMAGDARAHYAGAKYGYFLYSVLHDGNYIKVVTL